MDEPGVNWWMDANNRWHRGRPPAGWWQAENRQWHPPAKHEPIEEVRESPPRGPAHFVGGARSPGLATGRGWPRWVLYAVLALVAVAAVTAVVVAAITDSS
jgi:hypothetical protein